MSVRTTGLREYAAAIDRLPATVKDALREAALAGAQSLQGDLQATIRARQWGFAGDVHVVHYPTPGATRYAVEITPRAPRPTNLPLWLEHGTRHMAARPFHGPAEARLRATYPRSVDAAFQRALDRTVNR